MFAQYLIILSNFIVFLYKINCSKLAYISIFLFTSLGWCMHKYSLINCVKKYKVILDILLILLINKY